MFKIDDKNDYREIGNKLKSESSGIFNWALEGYQQWQEFGLATPNLILESTEEYRNEEDLIGQFIKDECIEEESSVIDSNEFKKRFYDSLGYKISQKKICDYIAKSGYKEKDNRYME